MKKKKGVKTIFLSCPTSKLIPNKRRIWGLESLIYFISLLNFANNYLGLGAFAVRLELISTEVQINLNYIYKNEMGYIICKKITQ